MLDCRGGTRLSMPLRLLREYVRAQILREADPQNLKTARILRLLLYRETSHLKYPFNIFPKLFANV